MNKTLKDEIENKLRKHKTCENPLNYNLSKINKVPNRLNKRIPSIVIGYNRIKYKMFR